MTQKDPNDVLKAMVKELESAHTDAEDFCGKNGITFDRSEPGILKTDVQVVPRSPDDAAFDAASFVGFWFSEGERLVRYAHGGELGDIKPVPEEAKRWLRSNGYGHLIGKLDMVCGQ
jgi:hypothetical protein